MKTKTKYFHKLPDGRMQCDTCPNFCKLKNGQRGRCFVRQCQGDDILLTTYGLISGFAIDPIEKKPLYHFLPGSRVLSFGTIGCNLNCQFCQNFHISQVKDGDLLKTKTTPKEIADLAEEYHCQSVAFTYNEPTIYWEFARDVAIECHRRGIKTVAVSNGYICAEPRKDFFEHIDAANIDLKAFTEDFYKNITGSHLEPVLETLLYLKKETKVWLEVTCLLIPNENDSEEELDLASKWIFKNLGPDVPVHYSAFHPTWKMLDKPPTPAETLYRAREIALKNGLKYVYLGNLKT